MNHKNFVFFDCECANNFDGVGKICSLGYAVCDDDLNVLESEDVVMNPECEFDWYLFSGKGECKLAYSKDYFRIKPNFEAYYKDIKKLFTTGNRYILGFAVSNDVAFVNSACQRYEKEYINFRAFDIEPFLAQTYGEKHKLKEWAEKFGVNVAKFESHKSVDDAMMTMLCFKKACQEQNKSIEEVLNEHKDLFVSSEQMLIAQQERAYRREIMEKIKRLYNKKSPKPRYKGLLDQYFEIDGRLLKDVDTSFELVKKIYDNGGISCEHLVGKGKVIFAEEPKAEIVEKLKKRGLGVITLDQMFEILK
ncbi:MAG: hypothetical protein K5866_11215 [Treponema sp.]|nr:hypothetical protein [Treponema sp.]